MPILPVVTCAGCNLRHHVHLLSTFRRYRNGGGRQWPLNAIIGYCHACAKPCVAESLPTAESIAQETERMDELRRRDPCPAEAAVPVRDPDVAYAVLALGRKPVCLGCRSSGFLSFPALRHPPPKTELRSIPDGDKAAEKIMKWRHEREMERIFQRLDREFPTSVRHPGCGGYFSVNTRSHLYVRPNVSYFDLEARLIESAALGSRRIPRR